MASFDFLDAEANEAAGSISLDRSATRRAPAEWSAASRTSQVDRAAVGSAGGGSGGGPSLPFRIREVQLYPKSIGSDPVFSIAK
eukprot:CAMPEP_0197663902 /NCGR_PEP_ID=MMETSP1338-20131121/58313_1 /TAXON_ID=43686 ORGANISM="Pelagodinium beii, Strain RCC1491" /NCGR_SAMPLE_ID=MMETSP1338 /ASSEMBLY_ACC=CAM_ASM_000754 /LENGTH=83 /DNA_ID=CAMNT_0043242431 /DNA_START=69 /DNA_END=317 /DNA_ORIENTATION=+